jgi:hypothetical protein
MEPISLRLCGVRAPCVFVCFPHFECQAARGADAGVAQTAKEVLAKLA